MLPHFIRERNGTRKNEVKKAKQLSHLLGNLFIHVQNHNFKWETISVKFFFPPCTDGYHKKQEETPRFLRIAVLERTKVICITLAIFKRWMTQVTSTARSGVSSPACVCFSKPKLLKGRMWGEKGRSHTVCLSSCFISSVFIPTCFVFFQLF